MSCKDNAKLLDGYADGELDLRAALALEEHLQSCARCKGALARLEALRGSLRRHAGLEAAPGSLRERLRAMFAPHARVPGLSWGWGVALAAPGVAALLLTLWLGFFAPHAPPAAAATTRVVYHIPNSATAGAALRNIANHLNATPGVKIVVVAHNDGVGFLLRGARDEAGQLFEPAVSRVLERGVQFRVCGNTLQLRGIDARRVIPAASLVPSGIAEIGRLQAEEGYAYMRL